VETIPDAPLAILATLISDKTNALLALQYKVEAMHGVVVDQRTKWLHTATSDLELAWADVLFVDALFLDGLGKAARYLEVSPESTLREVIEASPVPYDFVLGQGRTEMLAIINEISRTEQLLASILARNHLATSAAIEILGGVTHETYDRSGSSTSRAVSAHSVDLRS
jgi:hypothetical protein